MEIPPPINKCAVLIRKRSLYVYTESGMVGDERTSINREGFLDLPSPCPETIA